MPLEKLVLILAIVIGAAAATIWGATALFASFAVSPTLGIPVLGVIALAVFILFRVVSERLNNAEDDHYDGMEN